MDTHLRYAIVLIAVVALGAALQCDARADGRVDGRVDGRAVDAPLEVHLARVAVHEAGLERHADAVAIWSVLRWRSLHVPELVERCGGALVCVARAYAAERDYREAWIGQLGLPVAKPSSWPDQEVSWERYGQSRWTRMIELARRWLRGEMPPPCRYTPHHWGARRIAIDVARAERAVAAGRWRDAECYDPVRREPTANGFYSIVGG
jgi:hypothetical protein